MNIFLPIVNYPVTILATSYVCYKYVQHYYKKHTIYNYNQKDIEQLIGKISAFWQVYNGREHINAAVKHFKEYDRELIIKAAESIINYTELKSNLYVPPGISQILLGMIFDLGIPESIGNTFVTSEDIVLFVLSNIAFLSSLSIAIDIGYVKEEPTVKSIVLSGVGIAVGIESLKIFCESSSQKILSSLSDDIVKISYDDIELFVLGNIAFFSPLNPLLSNSYIEEAIPMRSIVLTEFAILSGIISSSSYYQNIDGLASLAASNSVVDI